MRKIYNFFLVFTIFLLFFNIVVCKEDDDFWKMADLADEADRIDFKESISKARRAAIEWNFKEAENYIKNAYKYIVDVKDNLAQIEDIKKLIDEKKKEKFEYEQRKNNEESIIEEGDIGFSILELVENNQNENNNKQTQNVIQKEESRKYVKVPVYFRSKSQDGSSKYVVRYKDLFFIFTYDNNKGYYYKDNNNVEIKYDNFFEIMKKVCREINYIGSVNDCIEVTENELYK